MGLCLYLSYNLCLYFVAELAGGPFAFLKLSNHLPLSSKLLWRHIKECQQLQLPLTFDDDDNDDDDNDDNDDDDDDDDDDDNATPFFTQPQDHHA